MEARYAAMTTTRDDVYRLIGYIQDDLRQTQAKLVELRAMLAAGAMNSTSTTLTKCPHCPVELAPRALADHLHTVHDIPQTA